MSHYILRYRDGAAADIETVEKKLAEIDGVTVLSKMERMFLVDVDSREALSAVSELAAGWLVAPEVKYKIPDTRPRLRPPQP